LILRVWLGLNIALSHGWGKLTGFSDFINGGAMAQFPAPIVLGTFAVASESLGGLLIAIGWHTRIAATCVMGTMAGAAFVIHGGDPWGRKEFALTYCVLSLVMVLMGPGRWSVDKWRMRGKGE
jgi:putative oxidoreductase